MSVILERLRNYIPGENDDEVPLRIKEAADEIDRLLDVIEDAIDTLESMDLHIDNPLYARLVKALMSNNG